MRKKSILLVIIIIMQLLTGCRDATEVTDIAIVEGIGFDKADNGEIILSLILPVTRSASFGGLLGGGGGGGATAAEATILISEKGYGIMDAYRKIEKKLSRKIFLSQVEGIFIGEKLAREGISDVIDFLFRHPEPHLRAYMFFTEEAATDILSLHSKLERSIIEKFVKEVKLEAGFRTNLKDFINMITEEGVEPVAAQVIVRPLVVDGESKSITSGIGGAAVLHKYKLVGWMTAEEARGALWLRNEIKRGVITTNVPDEKNSGKVGIDITKAKTEINPILNGDEVKMEVKVYVEGKIYENSSQLDLSDSEAVHFVEGKVSENIKKRIQLSLEKAQKQLKSDVYGFGTAVYRKYPQKWNNYYKERWDEEFPMVNVRIICDVRIPEIGLSGKNLTPDNEKP
ncbi:Ger(x)C family spore germination protein [Clostridium sp. DJ247]|uniref:Ger(x)C family spore germination protein n=1 Tax=Clostridium sp. DJ247 TaxID=2726188 RepID=UPI00162A27CE|nr:Ger(x)C family spore germination protein [Clostridium sp. DJ247]MBC2579447.1 Ger(x)C family spore germination protein [Clostridium sp. DJ247]